MGNSLPVKTSPVTLTEEQLAEFVQGDWAKMPVAQRTRAVVALCNSLQINPLTKPFDFIPLNGKLTLYALRGATDQLRKIHNVSIEVLKRETVEGVHSVYARATLPNGRMDEAVGSVPTKGLSGNDLANALMKAETKAKRRVTLSICGLGFLDETEVETIKSAGITSAQYDELETLARETHTDLVNVQSYVGGTPLQEISQYQYQAVISLLKKKQQKQKDEVKA